MTTETDVVPLVYFEQLFCAYDVATSAFATLQHAGCDRSDVDLASDGSYNQLLSAGIALYKLGGPSVVQAAANRLSQSDPNVKPSYIARLWNGLLTENAQQSSVIL